MNLTPGTSIRLKTKGDTILIESLAKNDEKKGNYAGENVGDAWSAKIQAAKSNAQQEKKVMACLCDSFLTRSSSHCHKTTSKVLTTRTSGSEIVCGSRRVDPLSSCVNSLFDTPL